MTSLKVHAWLMLRNGWGFVLGGGAPGAGTQLAHRNWDLLLDSWISGSANTLVKRNVNAAL